MAAAPTYVQGQDGALLTVRTDWHADPGGPLTLSAQFGSVAVCLELARDDDRDLVQALDDWLVVSRPR